MNPKAAGTAKFPDLALSVIVPAYNEERNIEHNIPRMVESLRRNVGSFELILIDDCSRDSTAELAQRLADRFAEIVLVRNPVNLRQGPSLAKGFAMARYDLVMHNGMDSPFAFDDLPFLLEHFPKADVVVAARRTYPGTTFSRRLMSAANRALIRALFGTRLRDYNFVQVYKRSVLDAQTTFAKSTPFITPEKIIRACRSGLNVVEVEVDYHHRAAGKPSSANWRNIRAALGEMGRLWRELRRQ
jgi:glycosyltransferase involved in cell wall biosynthesis